MTTGGQIPIENHYCSLASHHIDEQKLDKYIFPYHTHSIIRLNCLQAVSSHTLFSSLNDVVISHHLIRKCCTIPSKM